MAVTFELPFEIEQNLRKELGDLDGAAKEALLVDLHRRGRLTHHQLSGALGLSRLETDAVLHRHGIFYDLSTEDVIRESEGLRKLRDAHADRR
jgi:hypothetical protein